MRLRLGSACAHGQWFKLMVSAARLACASMINEKLPMQHHDVLITIDIGKDQQHRNTNLHLPKRTIIMNASNAFRSSLMHQFIAQAKAQSRPPLALLSVISGDDDQLTLSGLVPPHPSMGSIGTGISSIHTSSLNSSVTCNVRRRHTDSEITRSQSGRISLNSSKNFSAIPQPDFHAEEYTQDEESSSDASVAISEQFQNLLQTRRTRGRLEPLAILPPLYESQQDFFVAALDRAVKCGYQAPNHKRTEPFVFKRMISPSKTTQRLAEISYHVNLRKQLSKEGMDLETATVLAENKQAKWSKIPAFLVTTVREESYQYDPDAENLDEYSELPYKAPATELELENYAAASAAVQNVLLSLHSEKIATKWATGPVIKTPAFRELIEADPRDRVVALVMVGGHGPADPRPRRRKNRHESLEDI